MIPVGDEVSRCAPDFALVDVELHPILESRRVLQREIFDRGFRAPADADLTKHQEHFGSDFDAVCGVAVHHDLSGIEVITSRHLRHELVIQGKGPLLRVLRQRVYGKQGESKPHHDADKGTCFHRFSLVDLPLMGFLLLHQLSVRTPAVHRADDERLAGLVRHEVVGVGAVMTGFLNSAVDHCFLL